MGGNINNTVPDKLDPRVVTVTIFISVMEFEIFTFAKGVVAIAKQDAWISVILGGVIAALTTALTVKLASRFPRENYFQYNRVVWGRLPAFVLAVGYLIYWAVYLTILYQDSNYANKLFFLGKTPSIVPMLVLAIAAAWLALYGMTAIVRFFQMAFPFMLIPLLVLFILAVKRIELVNFLPVFSNGFLPVLKGAFYYAGILQGLEVILFLSPFLTDVRKSFKPALAAVGLIWFMTFFQLIATVGLLGIESIKHMIYPGYSAITLIELPGFPVERFELFLTLPWIIGVFTTMCIFTYLLSFGIIQIFNLSNRKAVVFIVTGVIVAATYIFPNLAIEEKMRGYFSYATLLLVYLLPVLTLVIAVVRAKRDVSHE